VLKHFLVKLKFIKLFKPLFLAHRQKRFFVVPISALYRVH
jgi:hypothetical protein